MYYGSGENQEFFWESYLLYGGLTGETANGGAGRVAPAPGAAAIGKNIRKDDRLPVVLAFH
jgi:hypothetical protein